MVNTGRQVVEVIMGMVGQQFEDEQDTQINGAVVSIRNRGDKVAVWVSEVEDRGKVWSWVRKILGRVRVFKAHKPHIWKL